MSIRSQSTKLEQRQRIQPSISRVEHVQIADAIEVRMFVVFETRMAYVAVIMIVSLLVAPIKEA